VSRDGSEEPLPLPLNAPGRFRDPAISPDGRRIAFERTLPGGRVDIWIYDRDQGGVLRRLTSEGDNLQPFWSPDGTEVGFSSIRLGTMALFSQPWDGSAPARLLRAAGPGRPLFEGVWSPDGRTVVYREEKFPASSNFASAAPHPDSTANLLFESPFAERAPALSPDGRWIAYQSDESGRIDVYVRPFLRAGGSTPVSRDGGESPVWTPDGTEIIYREPGGAWWAATVRTEPEFVVTFREQLPLRPGLLREGEGPHFDVSPDDGRILAIRGSTSESTIQHIVILNFFEELREGGAPLRSDPVLRLNAALTGRYEIERELGRGGMATVCLARDLRHERKVALKVLKPELAAVVGAERFLAEIRTTANLQHPHILPLHDSGEADGLLFYVMPTWRARA
jgi:hypothetical protein